MKSHGLALLGAAVLIGLGGCDRGKKEAGNASGEPNAAAPKQARKPVLTREPHKKAPQSIPAAGAADQKEYVAVMEARMNGLDKRVNQLIDKSNLETEEAAGQFDALLVDFDDKMDVVFEALEDLKDVEGPSWVKKKPAVEAGMGEMEKARDRVEAFVNNPPTASAPANAPQAVSQPGSSAPAPAN